MTDLEEMSHRQVRLFAESLHLYLNKSQSWSKRLIDYPRIRRIVDTYHEALKNADRDRDMCCQAHMVFISAIFHPDIIFLSYSETGDRPEYSFITPDADKARAWDMAVSQYGIQYYVVLPGLRDKVNAFHAQLVGELHTAHQSNIASWLQTWRPEEIPQETGKHAGALEKATLDEVSSRSHALRIKYTLLCLFGLISGGATTVFTYDLLGLSKPSNEHGHVPTLEGWIYVGAGTVGVALGVMLLYSALSSAARACSTMSHGVCNMCLSREAKQQRQERSLQQLRV